MVSLCGGGRGLLVETGPLGGLLTRKTKRSSCRFPISYGHGGRGVAALGRGSV